MSGVDSSGGNLQRTEEAEYIVFRKPGGGQGQGAALAPISGLRVELWRPSLGIVPPEQSVRFATWWAFHQAGMFRSRTYGVLLVFDGERVVHRSCVMPAWFRWPFMAKNDVHISDTSTAPDYRGRGIAVAAARRIIDVADPSRNVWYATQTNNAASLSVGRRSGMEQVGRAIRTKRMGLRLLGRLEMASHSN